MQRGEREQPEGGQHAAHEGEEQLDGDLAGRLLGATPAVGAHLGGEPAERVAERRAVAVGRDERGDERPHGLAGAAGHVVERVAEPAAERDLVERDAQLVDDRAVGAAHDGVARRAAR